MNQDAHISENLSTWNETAAIHEAATMDRLLEQMADPTFSTFDAVEKELYARIGLAGKTVAQLACNNGRELISVQRAGAETCVGFDFSQPFLDQGSRLAAAAGAEIEWVCSNLYEIPATYDGRFDLIYFTVGALGWMLDLAGLFQVIDRLLKPGGQLFLYEMHPVLDMLEPEKGPVLQDCYFRTEPFRDEDSPDYMDPTKIAEGASWWFHHKMSDIIQGALDIGLMLEHFREYSHDISNVYAPLKDWEAKPPMCYTLLARKS